MFPYHIVAVKATETTAATTAAAASTSVGTAAFVAAVVVVVVVGSVARGIQVNKQNKQKESYEGMLNEKGTTLDVSGFELEDEKGKDNELNQAIMFGALASMLFSGE
jgi:cytochrome oxidase Cu insertion factor (SCO1/SenC/PrrC family)